MSHNLPHQPAPGPECTRYVLLLPLLDADELATTEADAVRRHTGGCPWCQQQLAAYATVDSALHRHLDVLMAEAPIHTEETIMRMSKRDEHEHSANSAQGPIDTSHEVKVNNGAITPIARHRVSTPVHTLLAGAIAVTIVGLLATTFAVFSHRSTASVGATATPAQQTPYVAGADDGLNAIQMLSPGEGWAVGDSSAGRITQEVVLHFVNGQWWRVPTPTTEQFGVVDASLQSIAMVSPEEGWAVGDAGDFVNSNPSGLILHYSGGRWTKFSITPNEQLSSVQMLTPTDGWAVGGGGPNVGVPGETTSILLHYNGSIWAAVPVPHVDAITSLDMVSTHDGWATGTDTILHYDGTKWSIFAHLQSVTGVSMDSASDGWAFGYDNFPNAEAASYNVVWHYNGSRWVPVTLPSSLLATSVAFTSAPAMQAMSMDSASDGWAVGYGNGQKGGRYSLYVHYSHGQWTQVQGPNSGQFTSPTDSTGLSGVFMLSANEGWACGDHGVLMHYLNGTWTQYQA